ncbi:MAG: ABC transporter substrate-binding protein/permease [Lactobacillus sp.]|jgi:polar amino acid transport system substrate-binding protein|nr:ABC transporter substrate-binding protein/permease [Lactobacillus sp.]
MKFVVKLVSAIIAMVSLAILVPPHKAQAASHYTIGTETTFVPYAIQGKDGTYNGKHPGIDMEILRAIAKNQHFTFDLKIMNFAAIVQALQSGQVDGNMAAMMVTPERQQTLDFSHTYLNAGLSLATKPGSSIKSYKDLKGKIVAVKTGSTSETYATSIQNKYGFTIHHLDSTNTEINDVTTGNADAAIDATLSLQYTIKNGMKLRLIGTQQNVHPVAFAVKKGENAALLQKFNNGLANIKKNGTYAKIMAYYTGAKAHTNANIATDRSYLGIIKANAPQFKAGITMTIKLTVVSIIIATIVGVFIGLFGVVPSRLLKGFHGVYTFIFRSIPVMVLSFFIYMGIPSLIGHKIPLFTAGVATLVLENSAYIASFVAGGIKSVDRGQMEASRSLGVTYLASMRKVIMPQAVRTMAPSFINQFIIALKGTSILSAIGLAEMTQQGTIIISQNMEGFKVWLIITVMYLVLIGCLTLLSDRVQKHYSLAN